MIDECLHKPTLEWVLKKIQGYIDDGYSEYCSSLDHLEEDISDILKEK